MEWKLDLWREGAKVVEEQRDTAWLRERVQLIWENHFRDVAVGYPIEPEFGSRARYRFGSIAARNGKTQILINRLFADPFVPVYVVDATLAHELAHYAHGFGSGLPRLYDHAHRGGVVDKELENRGLGPLSARAYEWRQVHWEAFYATRCPDITNRRTRRDETVCGRWNVFLRRSGCRDERHLQHVIVRLAPRFGFSGSPPYETEWLNATLRQTSLSYWYAKERRVRVHGLLSDPRVPECVVEWELGYWLARQAVGNEGNAIRRAVQKAGMEETVDQAHRWRRHAWTAFRNRNHPLASDGNTERK